MDIYRVTRDGEVVGDWTTPENAKSHLLAETNAIVAGDDSGELALDAVDSVTGEEKNLTTVTVE